MNDKKLLDFFCELGRLKQMQRSGWNLVGEGDFESDADHVLRAAQIGYVLACLEGTADPEHVASLLLFHEIAETRSGDPDRIAKRYVEIDDARIVDDQTKPLSGVGEGIKKLWTEFEERTTPAGIIAKDADKLETALTGREIFMRGHPMAATFFELSDHAFQTESAKRIAKALHDHDPDAWWTDIQKEMQP